MTSPIFGAAKWRDPDAFYDQTNNPTEHVLKFRAPSRSFLESCGPTAAVNCQASVGRDVHFETPGGYSPQPEEVLMDWFNDSKNFVRMKAQWAGLDPRVVLGNEVAQWYPLAIEEVFGGRCEFAGAVSADRAVEVLRQGCALQVCLKNPGHFFAVVAYDSATHDFIVKDSWGARWPQGDGFCQRMPWTDFETTLRPLSLIHRPGGLNYAARP